VQINFANLSNDYLNRTRIFLILFCVALASQFFLGFATQLRYFKTRPAKVYGPPPRLLGRFTLPSLTDRQFVSLGVVFVLSLCCAALNFVPRLFLVLALLCYFLYFNPIMSLAYIQRKTNLVPIVLLALLFAPGIGESLKQPEPEWPLLLIKLAVAQMYFSAGIQKLRSNGLRWANGRSLRAYLLEHYLWGDSRSALVLARRPSLCMALSSLLLLFELTFWVILVRPQLTLAYIAAGVTFHLGTALTMRINYLKYLSPVYIVFLPEITFQLRSAIGW
jgi:hypothetical protein